MTIVENMIKRSKASGRPAADAPADKARAGEPQQAGSKLEGRGPKIELENLRVGIIECLDLGRISLLGGGVGLTRGEQSEKLLR